MDSLWAHLAENNSPQVLEFWGTLLVQLVFFWGATATYAALDYIAPQFSQRHKLQPQSKQPTYAELKDCLHVVVRNQLLSVAVHASLLAAGALAGGKPAFSFSSKLPSASEVLKDIFICIILREALFYYSHRTLHLPSFYPKIHKVHHRFTAPVALAAQYAHPIEHFVANTLPISLPPMLLHCHIVTFWIFLAFELLETTTVHSGYDFLRGVAKKHDAHHEKFMVNFGALGLLDWLHGTDGSRARAKRA